LAPYSFAARLNIFEKILTRKVEEGEGGKVVENQGYCSIPSIGVGLKYCNHLTEQNLFGIVQKN
jgi:hypothetical protein